MAGAGIMAVVISFVSQKAFALVDDVNYTKHKIRVDQERYVPLKEELFAKCGQLLKKTTMSGVKQIGKRWYPTTINYKDMLSIGSGTCFVMTDIPFNLALPALVRYSGRPTPPMRLAEPGRHEP